MDIPDRLSDMDSVPETISLTRNHGATALVCGVAAAYEDIWTRHIPALGKAADKTAEALVGFGLAIIVAESS